MRRIFADSETIRGDRIHVTDKDEIVYLSHVLRMKAGDPLLVTDGAGKRYETRIAEITKNDVVLRIISEDSASKDGLKTRITLYQGLPKGAKMDEIVRKSTELGADRIIPVLTARAVPEYRDGIPAAKLARLRRIAEEASRQSRRIRVPEVTDALAFGTAADSLRHEAYDLTLVLFELEESNTLKNVLHGNDERLAEIRNGQNRSLKIAVFIGPEGGFEQTEIDRLTCEGAASVTVGETILRTETAGPAAVAMILYELEQ